MVDPATIFDDFGEMMRRVVLPLHEANPSHLRVDSPRPEGRLLFLYRQEPTRGQPHEFLPYRFGAFSFTSSADWRTLVEHGFLTGEDF